MTEKTIEETNTRIIRPIYDFSFKAIFERNDPEVVADFLKAVLSLPEDEYEEISFKNPYLHGRTKEEKLSIVDLLLHTKNKNIIHIEMQFTDKKNFIERLMFYNARLLSGQLISGEKYGKIRKAISIIVTNFSLSELSSDFLRKASFRYDNGELFSDLVEFHTLEIVKVPELSDGTKKWEWAKFFSSETKEEFTMCAEKNPAIKKAVGKLIELSEDERNFMIAERIEKDRRDRIAEIDLGVEKGIEQGIEQGIQQGIEQGIAQGIEQGIQQGIQQTKLQTAMVMLSKNFSITDISEVTGLSEKQISSIQIEK